MSETLVHTLLLDQCVPGTNTWSDILQSVNLESSYKTELSKIFGLDPKTLQLKFGEIFQDILRVFNFFNSENTPDKIVKSAQIPNFQDVTQHNTIADMSAMNNQTEHKTADMQDKTRQIPDIKTIIRLLVHLYDKLSSGLAFTKNTLVRLPYIFDGFGMVKIDFDNKTSFKTLICQEIKLEAFTSVR